MFVSLKPISSGDNDLARNHSPKKILENMKLFIDTVKKLHSNISILILSIKPSPARIHLLEKSNKTNKLIAQYAKKTENVHFLDLSSKMLMKNNKPDPTLFGSDRLHMNKKGYDLWTNILTPILKKLLKKE
ncbi:MAG: GDSL-type esterase/lipase family protein [Verrucomicrobiota bacterium]|nr:GDSL-type esterase/lipase family protein [Verrucomicrobiota bacterium]